MQKWKKGLFIGLFSSLLWEQQSVQASIGLAAPVAQRPFPPEVGKTVSAAPPVPIWEPPKEPELMESVTNLRVLLEEKRLQAPPPPPPPKLSSRGGLLQAPKPQQTQSTNRSAPESNPAPTILNQGQSGATATQTGKLAAVAVKYQGSPYAFVGTTPGGFDCSGFIQYVFQECGISLPRTTYEQIGAGIQVSRANLQPGDLVFFSCGGQSTSHAGIYLGDGRFIHADQTHGVHIAELSNTYWASAYQTGVRVR